MIVWRYSINYGDFGGIVLGETLEQAKEKVKRKYGDVHILVWKMVDDDYFDEENQDVFECY